MLQLHQMITDLPYPLPQDVIVEALHTVSRESAIAMLIGMHNDAKRRHQASWLILWKAARFLATSYMWLLVDTSSKNHTSCCLCMQILAEFQTMRTLCFP